MANNISREFEVSESFRKKLMKNLRIDPRYSILDFQQEKNFLHIFIDVVENAIRISRIYQQMSPDRLNSDKSGFKIKVTLLPDKSIGNLTKGICHVAVAPLRRLNASSSEQMTQVLYGESFDPLQVAGDWIRIRLHLDGYIGWVSSNQVTLFTEDDFEKFQAFPKVFVKEKILSMTEKKGLHPIREAVHGNQLAVVGDDSSFVKVKIPDGTFAYVRKSGVSFVSPSKKFSTKKLLETARMFEGISYVWGGRSSIGLDCSGFVQTVFRLNGIELPRDTDLQFSAGKFIGKQFKKMRPGDLLFFSSNGNKINHVAIYFGRNKEFIHSSGFVGINSLDPRRKNFSKRLLSRFVGACRVDVKK